MSFNSVKLPLRDEVEYLDALNPEPTHRPLQVHTKATAKDSTTRWSTENRKTKMAIILAMKMIMISRWWSPMQWPRIDRKSWGLAIINTLNLQITVNKPRALPPRRVKSDKLGRPGRAPYHSKKHSTAKKQKTMAWRQQSKIQSWMTYGTNPIQTSQYWRVFCCRIDWRPWLKWKGKSKLIQKKYCMVWIMKSRPSSTRTMASAK